MRFLMPREYSLPCFLPSSPIAILGHDFSSRPSSRCCRPDRLTFACNMGRTTGQSRSVDDQTPARKPTGEIFLVGTGPGDPKMLTLGAVELMRSAEVVLYDRLVSDEILSFISDEAAKICVGKGRGIGTGSQMSIQEQLAFHARRGKRVVRLKGGDPAIFGRLGDELCYLRDEHNLEAVAVPGVTAASGVAARLGFPLTHGHVAESVRICTGHLGQNRQFEIERFQEGTTLVIYMGLKELPGIVQSLMDSGARGNLPSVAVQSGTTAEQREVWATLEHLPDMVRSSGLQSPTLIIIGEVVRMAREWPFGRKHT